MGHSLSTEKRISPSDRQTLLQVARGSINHGLISHQPPSIDPGQFSIALQVKRAVFVTLKLKGALRGCIGMLEPIHTIVEGVSSNAYRAAFKDPRFPPLSRSDADHTSIHIALLTYPHLIQVANESDLLRQLHPERHGLILKSGSRQATFLPSVWQLLNEPRRFVQQLKLKAGLSADAWPPDLQFQTYEVESVE